METTNTPPSAKGKGLGMAGMIIGIVCAVLAIIPGMAMVMMVIAILGLVLSAVGLAQANKGGNPNKGIMIAGLILNLLVVIYAIVQIVFLASAVATVGTDFQNMLDTMKFDTIH